MNEDNFKITRAFEGSHIYSLFFTSCARLVKGKEYDNSNGLLVNATRIATTSFAKPHYLLIQVSSIKRIYLYLYSLGSCHTRITSNFTLNSDYLSLSGRKSSLAEILSSNIHHS